MVKKKAQPLKLEERPEFLAVVANLPDDVEAMHARAGQLRAVYNDAIVAGDDRARDAAALEHDAIVFKLNGGTFFGCRGDATRPGKVLDALHTVKPGQVPTWGQDGEFLVEVEGVRVLVKYECQGLRSAPGFDARAVDFDKPFISPTGYQGVYLTVADHMGRTLEQAVRAEISEQIAAEGLKPIAKEDLQWIKNRPAWLVEVLADVTRDGQLAMFGDQPEQKKPMTGAERQRRRRQKLRELKEAEGLKPVMLTDAERRQLFAALDLENSIKPHYDPEARLALLNKVCPGAVWTNDAVGDSPTGDRVLDEAFERPAHTGPERESLRNLVLICTLRKRNSEHAELVRAVERLGERLRAAGLDPLPNQPSVSRKGGVYYWNENPPIDYRPTTPPGDHTPHLTADDEVFFRPAWMRE